MMIREGMGGGVERVWERGRKGKRGAREEYM